jgi:D-inositol-3-phosphate glycosyltransferase
MSIAPSGCSVALLTGGSDKPYALGLASALAAQGIGLDFVGSDELDCPEVRAVPGLRFLNLRGDQSEDASLPVKAARIVAYYIRLTRYVATASAPVLHILWNNKFEVFDRTLLMVYYRAFGKRVVLTAHNVNVAARNGTDGWFNRLTLRIQYRLCDHVFVHTESMKRQLAGEFGVPERRVTVVPFGINDTIPETGMTPAVARRQLGVPTTDRLLLFFGQIAPYKGLEYLIQAVGLLAAAGRPVRVIVAGKVKRGSEDYWRRIERLIEELGVGELVFRMIQFIPDDQVEPFFKAADAVVLPYVDIFQSGVPFLAFSFGVPVIATDVGSLREDVTRETGVLCRERDAVDLARAVDEFYAGHLGRDPASARGRIRVLVAERHSWETVAHRTIVAYGARQLAATHPGEEHPTETPEGRSHEATVSNSSGSQSGFPCSVEGPRTPP